MKTYKVLYVINLHKCLNSSLHCRVVTYCKPFTAEAAATMAAGGTVPTGSQSGENTVDRLIFILVDFRVNKVTHRI